MLAQHLQAPAKWSQHFNAKYHYIVGRNMLCCLATLLKTELVRMPGCNICCSIQKGCTKNLAISIFEPTTLNMSQHVATAWPNAAACCTNNVTICSVEMYWLFGRGFITNIYFSFWWSGQLPPKTKWAKNPKDRIYLHQKNLNPIATIKEYGQSLFVNICWLPFCIL